MQKDYIIREIVRTAKENGGIPLGRQKFENQTGIRFHDWYGKYWAKWGDALKEAGYEPNRFNMPFDDELLMNKLIELIREKGKFPTHGEIRMKTFEDKTFPSHNTFGRLGNKQEMVKKVMEYCEKTDELRDIVDICLHTLRGGKEIKYFEEHNTSEEYGFIYLMKYGKYYKIGRSGSAGRREYEVKLLLPEKVEMIHKIRTDDPVGIEAYWHKRFEDKRKSGEWFELTGADVTVFKRRKFM
ncbi:MAG: GIY-YIG nuclease family protein [Desulfobaccales bacterium]